MPSASSAVAPPGRPLGYASGFATPQVPPRAFASTPQLSSVPSVPQQQLSAVLKPQPTGVSAVPIRSLNADQFSPRTIVRPQANGVPHNAVDAPGDLQAEILRRQAAESRVQALEALVSQLRQRIAMLEEKRGIPADKHSMVPMEMEEDGGMLDDPIDRTICEYLERNPDFPVSVQKVAPNYYVFGDRGTVYVTQRGEHIVVRVGGGFKSLQVFMDERALMVTREAAAALSEKMQAVIP